MLWVGRFLSYLLPFFSSKYTMSGPVPVIAKEAPSSSGSSDVSDILDLKDDEGWEDAEPEEEHDQFISLLDDEVFHDVHSMLQHCMEKHAFDFLELRQRLGLDFYGDVKLVNYIRTRVHSGLPVSADISSRDIADEKFLKPVLEDDALLFNLDELPGVSASEDTAGEKGKDISKDSAGLITRVSELEDELKRMQSQFDDYRITVKQTLDDRWNEKSSAGSSALPAAEKEVKRDDDSHYFTSYQYNGQSHISN